jgi:hypothetical protein
MTVLEVLCGNSAIGFDTTFATSPLSYSDTYYGIRYTLLSLVVFPLVRHVSAMTYPGVSGTIQTLVLNGCGIH